MGGGPGGAAPLLFALAIAAVGQRRRCAALLILAVTLLPFIGGVEKEQAGGARRGPRRPQRRRLPPRRGPPRLEVVEGCFNRFDALAEVPVNEDAIVGHFNNIRCQVACGERGYALAATRSNPRACMCGNDYPSAFHQLDTGKCDAPCSPDQASCLLFTCCGDRNGTHFTVSFAQQQDVVLQVLRQMAFDYRTSSPTFRGEIEGAMVESSPLRVLAERDEGSSREDAHSCFLAPPDAGAAIEGCQDDDASAWVPFERACYKLHWAQSVAQDEARRQCLDDVAGSDLVVPASAAENAFVARLQGGCQGWLGVRLGEGDRAFDSSGNFHNFTEGNGDGGSCVQLAPAGGWVRAPCSPPSLLLLLRHHQYLSSHHTNCFVCQMTRDAAAGKWKEEPVTVSGADTDSWRLMDFPQQDEAEGIIGVRLQHEASGRFLGCSRESGRLVLLTAGGGGDRSTFVARIDEDDGGFTLTQGSLVVTLDEQEGRLSCRPKDTQHRGGWVVDGHAVARFEPTCILRVLAWRHLRLSVVVLSSDLQMRGWRECSVAAYDTSPTTVSYRCRPVPSVPAGVDEMWLEQQALLVSDQHRWLLPRHPLPLGRLRCVNEHPRTSAICTLAYGQGITMARAITIGWNTFTADTITTKCNVQAALTTNFPLPAAAAGAAAAGDRGGDEDSGNAFQSQTAALKELSNDFTVIYSQFYEVAVVRAYVETRNWQTSLRVRPLSTVTAQLWLDQVRLTYRWRALFQARGSFRVTYFGRPIGAQHAIGDVVNYDDIFFFVFGSYDVPEQASIVLTINDRDESRWPLDVPETTIVDEPFYFPQGQRR